MGAFTNQFRPRFHLTLQEAATRFGVTPQTLAGAVRAGTLRSKRAMHRSWVTPTAVAAFLDRGHAQWTTGASGR